MASKKDFNDSTCSRLDELYSDMTQVINKKPIITLYGKSFSVENIQNAIKHQPLVETIPKNPIIDMNGLTSGMLKFRNALKQLPRTPESVVMEDIRVSKQPGVEFFPSEMKIVKGKKIV